MGKYMKIDGNEKEKRALAAYYAGDKETYRKLQDEFVEEVRQAIANRENICPCKVACKYHGRCQECVAMHRAHRDHLPKCFHSMVNEHITAMAALTEYSCITEAQE